MQIHEKQVAAEATHTNGAVATQPFQMNPAAAPVSGLREQVRAMVHQELATMIQAEIRMALTGQTAPIFPMPAMLPVASLSGRVTNAMRLCNVEGCNHPVRSKGQCSSHYQQTRRTALKAAASTKRGKRR